MIPSKNKDNWKTLPSGTAALPDEITKYDEVWIFEAPANFDISTLDGKKIHFADGQIIDSSNGLFSKQLLVDEYKSLPWKQERVVLPDNADKANDNWRYATPAGRISVVDYLDRVQTDVLPSAVIARCPKLPTGLKRRYRPFGVERPSRKTPRSKKHDVVIKEQAVKSPKKHKHPQARGAKP